VPQALDDAVLARKMWRTLEPLHGMVYFAPEAPDEYARLGFEEQRAGYFATRAAPMGAVAAEVVIATFFNFHPELVRRHIPKVWAASSPARIVDARFRVAGAALERMLGAAVDSAEMTEAATLAREAALACRPEGRPLYAGHASVSWPADPHLVLWHAITLLREYRGDGHVAVLTSENVSACEALVLHAAAGDVPGATLRASRAWSDEEWCAASDGLRTRGWLDVEGELTDAGRAHRAGVEGRTDELALAPWRHIGTEACDRLRVTVRPWSRAVVDAGTFATSIWEGGAWPR
jgi:hypothetical protein